MKLSSLRSNFENEEPFKDLRSGRRHAEKHQRKKLIFKSAL